MIVEYLDYDEIWAFCDLGVVYSIVAWMRSGKSPPIAPGQLPHSMKGYELYSWEIGGEWYLALLVGTNRLKTPEEVRSSQTRVRGVEALKSELNRLPAGEEVAWAGRSIPWAVLPPDQIVEEVTNYCGGRGIILRVDRHDSS